MQKTTNSFIIIFLVLLTCILLGGFIGAATNMVNGAVSPYYFQVIMGWDFEGIWVASIAQGIFEGLIYGVIFSIIFTTGFALITKGQATYIFALQQLKRVLLIVVACWVIGGLAAIFLATLSPGFYTAHFVQVPSDKTEMIKYAWVGGSIWGAMAGGLIAAIIGLVMIRNNWPSQKSVAIQ